MSRTKDRGFQNTSSPKLTVPVHHRRPRFAALGCVFGDFLGGDRKKRGLLAGCLRPDERRGDDHWRQAHRFTLCFSFGTTHVPLARQTTIGFSKSSAAESERSLLGRITFLASKLLFRLLLPTCSNSPSTSMKSPA